MRFSWVIVRIYIFLLKKKGSTTGHETPVQKTARCLATIGSRMRVAFAFLHLSPFATLLMSLVIVMPVSYSTFQSLAHTTACAKTLSKCTMQAVNSTNRTEDSDFIRSILLRLLLRRRWRVRALCAPDCGQLLCQPLLQRPLTPFSPPVRLNGA